MDGFDQLLALIQRAAPNATGWVAFLGVIVWVVRVARSELREQRNAREATSTIGGRVGELERDLDELARVIASLGAYVPGHAPPPAAPVYPPAAPADVDVDQGVAYDDGPDTEYTRIPVPALQLPRPPASLRRHASR